MQYFGVPTCPYCKKRVNLIRTWSLKRQGEYQCPRCGGISNIFLSPLIYVFALLAVFAGGAVYFFHKFILDDISLSTVLQVLIPFAVFFFLSLFMVYLAKPIIKKVSKAELDKKKRGKSSFEDRRQPAGGPAVPQNRMFYDDQEYLPKVDYRTGPMPQEDDGDMKIVPASPKRPVYDGEMQKTFVVDIPKQELPRRPAARTESPAPQPQRVPETARRARVVEPDSHPTQRVESVSSAPSPRQSAPAQAGAVSQPVRERKVVSVETPSVTPVSNEDFFAKYDDPAYVERRLKELQEKRK